MNPIHTPQDNDQRLWKIARKKVAFKEGLRTYFGINAFLWLIWYFTDGNFASIPKGEIPWPIYPTLAWGLAMIIQYYKIHHVMKKDLVKIEFDKLKRDETV